MTDLATAIISGDRRCAARLISLAERGESTVVPTLQALYRAGGHARIIGVTGPPGVGKSTSVDQLVAAYRKLDMRVAVLAVDPSSPFSGGAVLGDRVRMHRHAEDPGVLIRSMAARGMLGGLAPATGDAVTILDAMRFDVIILETVGVGQSEIDILAHAECVLLLQTALGGDGVQMVKAGILEIADILVVNKADTPGSDTMVRNLRDMAAHTDRVDRWVPPVVATEATNASGIAELIAALDRYATHRASDPAIEHARRQRQVRARLFALAERELRRRLRDDDTTLIVRIDAIIARQNDPYDVATQLASTGAFA